MENKKLTPHQQKMKEIVEKFKEHLQSYTSCDDYLDYSEENFVRDMMYGIGIAINSTKFSTGLGFKRFLRTCWESWIKRYINEPFSEPLEITKED